ncbi:MAG: Crp/Fnr family transcriptional regulator [Candidatus Competibacteraceae bacterium]|nr:Crp/Fnr family transcriptional regulator [Candidatus Competibacteraceae bacterium]
MTNETAWRNLFPALAAGDHESQAILDAARLIAMPAEQPVFYAGSPCENYLLLLAGCIRVQVIGEGGREAVLYRVLPGQSCVLTTCCVLSGDAYPAEGYTETPVRALVVTKPAFEQALESAPAFRRFVFTNLGGRIAQVIARMEEVTFRPIEQRLARFLLSRADDTGILQATHQEISVELGTAREVVSRHLKRLEIAGILELGRSTVQVRKPSELRRLAETLL